MTDNTMTANTVNDMPTAIEKLLTAIKDDYATSAHGRTSTTTDDVTKKIRNDMINEFNESLTVKPGNKYIKVIHDNSVWGFVVNVDNDKKFKRGDILMAAGWSTPARNKPRGNVFDNYEIRWTGPLYLG